MDRLETVLDVGVVPLKGGRYVYARQVSPGVTGRTTGQRGAESCGFNKRFDPVAEQFRDRPGVIRHPCGHPRRSIHPPTIHLYAK